MFDDDLFLMVLGFLLGAVVTAIAFLHLSYIPLREEAVKRGYAEYFVKDYDTVGWRWKDAKP